MKIPVIDCLMSHRSIRKFKDQPVEDEKIELMLKAGMRAATGGNLQLYTFIVVDDPERKEALGLGFAPVVIVVLLDFHRLRRWLILRNPPGSDVCSTNPWHLMTGFCDPIIALQNVVVAAESMGLGTCYYGGIQAADVKEIFGAPEYIFPAGMITVGYPDEDPGLSMRLEYNAVVFKNEYRHMSDDEILEVYREREGVWDTLSEDLRAKLNEKGIHNIPEGIVHRKFSTSSLAEINDGILKNLRYAGFKIEM